MTPSPQPAKPALTPEEVIDWLENEAPAYELLFSPTARYSASKFSAMASTIRGLVEALEPFARVAAPKDQDVFIQDADYERAYAALGKEGV